MSLDDVGLIELNEAFASQALVVMHELGLGEEITNVEVQPEIPEGQAPEEPKIQKATVIGITIGILVVIAAVVAFAVFLLTGSSETTERIRDVFIIFMALESMVIGLVLIVLVVQLARLTNLLQNEIKPILDSVRFGVQPNF